MTSVNAAVIQDSQHAIVGTRGWFALSLRWRHARAKSDSTKAEQPYLGVDPRRVAITRWHCGP